MRSRSFIFGVLLLVGVSPSGHVKTSEESNMAQIEQYSGMNVFVAVGDGVKTLIVMEGDSVVLNSSVTELKRDDTILWMFGDDIIAKMNEAAEIFSTSEGSDGRFRDRLELDKQNGSLTIRNIRTEHTGHYQLKIHSTSETTKRFSVTVRDGGWKNVIKLNDHTGDLTIRNIQIQHSGDYDLEIINSTTVLHMKFNIAVSDLPESPVWKYVVGAGAGIMVIVVAVILPVWCKKKREHAKATEREDGKEDVKAKEREDANTTEKLPLQDHTS